MRFIAAKIAAVAVPLLFAAIVHAQHSDVVVGLNSGTLEIQPGVEGLAFEGEFGADALPPNVAQEPGFEAEPGTFVEGDSFRIDAYSDLLFWDGAQFAPVPAGHSVVVSLAIHSLTLAAGTGPQAGFTFAEADPDGSFHQDLTFMLNAPGTPDTGAYGLWMSVYSPAYGSSNSFIILLNNGLDIESFETGVAAAAALVPEPTSLVLLGIAALGVLRRR